MLSKFSFISHPVSDIPLFLRNKLIAPKTTGLCSNPGLRHSLPSLLENPPQCTLACYGVRPRNGAGPSNIKQRILRPAQGPLCSRTLYGQTLWTGCLQCLSIDMKPYWTTHTIGANSHVTLQATLIFCAETNKQRNGTKANDGFLLHTI